MKGKVTVESDMPGYFREQFEAGYAPGDEPPGMEERCYRQWKEEGGRVLRGPAAVARAAALADEVVVQVDPVTGEARFLLPFDPENQAPGSPREPVALQPGEGIRLRTADGKAVYVRVAPFAKPVFVASVAEVLEAVVRELAFQRVVYPQTVARSVSSHVLVTQEELREATEKAVKGAGQRPDALREMLQVAACAVACLMENGVVERLNGHYGAELASRGVCETVAAGDELMRAKIRELAPELAPPTIPPPGA